jgi:hypothetical protein
MRTVVGVLGVFALLMLLPTAQAGSLTSVTPPSTRTETIAINDYMAFSVNTGSVVGVRVTSGGNIDIYVTERAGYDDYIDPSAPSFLYLVAYTDENTGTYNKTVSTSGVAYIILDNDLVTVTGAQPAGPVTVSLFFGTPSSSLLLGVLIIVILVIVVVVFIVVRRGRRKAAPMPPPMPPMGAPPPMMPPQGPPPSPPMP